MIYRIVTIFNYYKAKAKRKNQGSLSFIILPKSFIITNNAEVKFRVLISNRLFNRVKAGEDDGIIVVGKDAFRVGLQNERSRELRYGGHRKYDHIPWKIIKEILKLQNQMIDASYGRDKNYTMFGNNRYYGLTC